MTAGIPIDTEAIADYCTRHHIRRMALFGSVLRDDFRPESDVDVLVEFEQGHVPGLAFFGLQDELTALLGRTVELCTPKCFGDRIRESVLSEAQTVYEEG